MLSRFEFAILVNLLSKGLGGLQHELTYIGFMDQCSGLQRMVRAFTGEIAVRQTSQLVINQWQQFIQRLAAAVAPILKQGCDLT